MIDGLLARIRRASRTGQVRRELPPARKVAVAIALFTGGCDLLGTAEVPDEVATPSVVGVIESRDRQADGTHIELRDGTTLVIPNGATVIAGVAEERELLIYGEDGIPGRSEGPWYAAVSRLSSGCYDVPVNGEVRGDRMALSYGFSLPLSDEWSETETEFIQSPPVGFCLDESGAVTRTD